MPFPLGLETNDYSDYWVLPGTTLSYSQEITPLDLTGCTATVTIKGIGPLAVDVTQAVTITVLSPGEYPTSILSFVVAATDTAVWTIGSYDYQILVTFADAVTVLPYGTGKVVVR